MDMMRFVLAKIDIEGTRVAKYVEIVADQITKG